MASDLDNSFPFAERRLQRIYFSRDMSIKIIEKDWLSLSHWQKSKNRKEEEIQQISQRFLFAKDPFWALHLLEKVQINNFFREKQSDMHNFFCSKTNMNYVIEV